MDLKSFTLHISEMETSNIMPVSFETYQNFKDGSTFIQKAVELLRGRFYEVSWYLLSSLIILSSSPNQLTAEFLTPSNLQVNTAPFPSATEKFPLGVIEREEELLKLTPAIRDIFYTKLSEGIHYYNVTFPVKENATLQAFIENFILHILIREIGEDIFPFFIVQSKLKIVIARSETELRTFIILYVYINTVLNTINHISG